MSKNSYEQKIADIKRIVEEKRLLKPFRPIQPKAGAGKMGGDDVYKPPKKVKRSSSPGASSLFHLQPRRSGRLLGLTPDDPIPLPLEEEGKKKKEYKKKKEGGRDLKGTKSCPKELPLSIAEAVAYDQFASDMTEAAMETADEGTTMESDDSLPGSDASKQDDDSGEVQADVAESSLYKAIERMRAMLDEIRILANNYAGLKERQDRD